MISNYQLDHGVMFSDDDDDRAAHVAVVTKAVATELFAKSDPVGKTIKISGLNFRVVGEVKNRGGGEGYSESEIFVPTSTAMHTLLGIPYLGEIFVEAEDGSDLMAVERDLVETLRNRHKILPGAPTTCTSITRPASSKPSMSGAKPPPSSSAPSPPSPSSSGASAS